MSEADEDFFPLITALRGCPALVKVGTIIGTYCGGDIVSLKVWMEGTSDQELIGRG